MEKQLNKIAQELQLQLVSVQAVIQLLQAGNTVPFIARYRKEATGNLDEVQIRAIQERHQYLTELEERRNTILSSIESQGKLTPELKEQIINCEVKTTLEDLYLPYKPKRRTRATIAREKGLEPLAELILAQPTNKQPQIEAQAFINSEKGVEDVDAALAGARDIVAEKISENIDVRTLLREALMNDGLIVSKAQPEKTKVPTKFEQYYDFKEKIKTIPSHRYLAIRRGEKEEILNLSLELDSLPVLNQLARLIKINNNSPFKEQLQIALEDAYKRMLFPSVEIDIRLYLKEISDKAAVDVFAENLRHLLMSAPMGPKKVIGIDPGIRTGCKCVAVDQTGKFLETITIYPSHGEKSSQESYQLLYHFINKYSPFAIAVGNGTAGRETEAFVKKLLVEKGIKETIVVSVNESGASIYSASDIAREEFPDLDLTIRGAISIARRLQDPLAELVKIDPKSIGVGQYQHDVYQQMLQDQLHQVVESCVNQVGVDLNTASSSLLSYVAGIGPSLAQKIVKYRETNGSFTSRQELKKVSGFGSKTFEQATGFLRIRDGKHPLDASAVHPERYDLVELMAKDLGVTIPTLMQDNKLVEGIKIQKYINSDIGELTLNDIKSELKKPGRDPRSTFEAPAFKDDVMNMQDLKLGMKLQGIVTNVTAFGAFVDIGVHQDGLIHLSELSDRFIKHPNEVVKTGDKIQVEVTQIDIERKRISLTARIGKEPKGTVINAPREKINIQKKPTTTFSSNPFAGL